MSVWAYVTLSPAEAAELGEGAFESEQALDAAVERLLTGRRVVLAFSIGGEIVLWSDFQVADDLRPHLDAFVRSVVYVARSFEESA